MKRLSLALLVSSLACSSVLAQVSSQPTTPPSKAAAAAIKSKEAKDAKKAATSEQQAQLDAMAKAAEPGPQHKLIEQFAGVWNAQVKQFASDGSVESDDKGVTTCKMVMGGRFLQSEHDGRFKGQFTRGGGLLGYNNAEKRVESTWAESTGTGISFMTGSFDAEGKVLTLTSEYTDADGKKATIKQSTKWTGKDTYTSEFTNGAGAKLMQIDYVRSAAAPKADSEGKRDTRDEMRAAQEEAKKALEKSKQPKQPAPK